MLENSRAQLDMVVERLDAGVHESSLLSEQLNQSLNASRSRSNDSTALLLRATPSRDARSTSSSLRAAAAAAEPIK